jgi:hypothetical protein
MDIVARFVTPGILFLLTLGFGFWLSHAGKPLNPIIFNLHKLIALAAVVLAAIQTRNALEGAEVQLALIALLGPIGLAIVALFVSGALMSANKPAYNTLRTIHRIAPPLAVIAAILALSLLGGRT